MFRSVAVSLLLIGWSVGPVGAQQWAAKMFKKTTHDFGAVARGSKAEFEFEFENLFEEDVHVASVRSSCGCTTPTIKKSSLKTFEKSAIVATYNTRSFLGKRGATLTVVFDRPYYAEVQLTVSGYIRSDVVCEPGEVNFGDVDQYQPAEQIIKVSYAGRSDWRIVDVRSSDHLRIGAELVETQRSGGRVSYDMIVRLKPDAPSGYLHGELIIVTDESRMQLVPLEVRGRVVSPLTISPASLFLGVLDPGQAVTKQLVVKGNKPFKVLNVKCDGAGFEFKPPADEPKNLHFIPVTFTAGEDPGKITQDIEIETDLGDGATAKCQATVTVRAKAAAP